MALTFKVHSFYSGCPVASAAPGFTSHEVGRVNCGFISPSFIKSSISYRDPGPPLAAALWTVALGWDGNSHELARLHGGGTGCKPFADTTRVRCDPDPPCSVGLRLPRRPSGVPKKCFWFSTKPAARTQPPKTFSPWLKAQANKGSEGTLCGVTGTSATYSDAAYIFKGCWMP